MGKSVWKSLVAGWLVFGALGCASAPRQAGPVVPTPTEPAHVATWTSIGTSVEGRPIRAWTSGSGERLVLYLGAIHGQERSSRLAVDELIRLLERDPQRLQDCRVVAVPVANPDGYARNTLDNVRGVNLNRNFPTRNFRPRPAHGERPGSEPETRALVSLIERERPDVIVSVHSPAACVDYDGPGQELAQRMSECCGLPVKKMGARPGSLGSFAGVDRHIPIVTLELPSHDPAGPAASPKYGSALLEALSGDTPVLAK